MEEAATRGAVCFPRRVAELLRAGLDLRDRHAAGEISRRGLAVTTGSAAEEVVATTKDGSAAAVLPGLVRRRPRGRGAVAAAPPVQAVADAVPDQGLALERPGGLAAGRMAASPGSDCPAHRRDRSGLAAGARCRVGSRSGGGRAADLVFRPAGQALGA